VREGYAVRARPGWLVALGLVVVLAGCCPPRLLSGPADEGRQAFVRACAPCHGVDGRGDGPVAPALRGGAPDLTLLRTRNGGVFPRALVIATITGDHEVLGHGTREMPVWSERFGSGSGAAAAASLYARRRLELLADHLESLQRTP
jgi:mono/diheme cytochrome c family protein